MKLINSSVEIIPQKPGLQGIYEQIELAARTCYKSESNIKYDEEGNSLTAKDFVDKIVNIKKHCFTGESEILTPKGWVKWKDYNGEQVAVVNEDLTFKGFETPIEVINHEYTGTFYKYPIMGVEVTSGHRFYGMFANNAKDRHSEFIPKLFTVGSKYKDANHREKTLGQRFFRCYTDCKYTGTLNPYMELVGFWIGDGCKMETGINSLHFHLKKKRKIKYLENLCKSCGFIFKKGTSDYYHIEEPGINKLFNDKFTKDGDKFIPDTINDLNDIYSIINGLINSDGSIGKSDVSYSSTSQYVINWILTHAPLVGMNVYQGYSRGEIDNQKKCYHVFFLKRHFLRNNDSRIKDSKVIITNKTENVYCVKVSTGLLLVRGVNGRTFVSGNCSVAEHGTVYLLLTTPIQNLEEYEAIADFYNKNPFSVVYKVESGYGVGLAPNYKSNNQGRTCYYITTNYRVLLENNRLDDLQYLCEPTEYHQKRVTVRTKCPISVSREWNRHRDLCKTSEDEVQYFSISEQSTRYCNYSKNKFGNKLTFCIPYWTPDLEPTDDAFDIDYVERASHKSKKFLCNLFKVEVDYLEYTIDDGLKPQEVREILPLCTATEVVYTGFISDWKAFFNLRTAENAHPDIRKLALDLQEQFKQQGLI
jgi:thymidylate synthase ThyX